MVAPFLPTTGFAQWEHCLLHTADIEFGCHTVFIERRKADKQPFSSKQFFDKGNGATTFPKPQGSVVRTRIKATRCGRLVVVTVVHLTISLKSRCKMAVCRNVDAGRVFQTTQVQGSLFRSPVGSTTKSFIRQNRQINIGRVFKFRGFGLHRPVPSSNFLFFDCGRSAGLFVVTGQAVKIIFDCHAILRSGILAKGHTHQKHSQKTASHSIISRSGLGKYGRNSKNDCPNSPDHQNKAGSDRCSDGGPGFFMFVRKFRRHLSNVYKVLDQPNDHQKVEQNERPFETEAEDPSFRLPEWVTARRTIKSLFGDLSSARWARLGHGLFSIRMCRLPFEQPVGEFVHTNSHQKAEAA